MANLKQLKCPSCGAVLNQEFPNQSIVECPYCHQQVVNSQDYTSNKSDAPRILEFREKTEDVIRMWVETLVNDQCVPADIFDYMNISSIKQYYFPMYIFEGIYRAPWSARIERYERRQRMGYNGKLEDYYERLFDYQSGEAAGNFTCNSASIEELERLGLGFADLDNIWVSPTSLPLLFQTTVNDNIEIIPPSHDSHHVWNISGKAKACNIGIWEAKSQAPGDSIECSASSELKNSWLVYIPIWKIEYEYRYKEEKYNYFCIAGEKDKQSKPTEELQIIEPAVVEPTEEEKDVLERYAKRNRILSIIRNIGCLGVAGIGLIGCYYVQVAVEKSYYNDSHYYYQHQNDSLQFFWQFFWVGITLLIVIAIIKYVFWRRDGIDGIEKNIEARKENAQKEAKKKQDTLINNARQIKIKKGKAFLDANGWGGEYNNSDDLTMEFAVDNPQDNYDFIGEKIETDSMCSPFCGKTQDVEEVKQVLSQERMLTEEPNKEEIGAEESQQDVEPTYELEEEKKSKKWLWVLLVIACLGAGAWFYFGSGMFEQSSEIEMEEDSELQKHLEEEQQKMEMMSFVKDFYSHYKEDGYIYDNVSESVLKKLRRDYPYECYEGDCLATWVFAAYPEGADMDFEVGPIITQTGSGIFNITFRYSYMNNGEKKYEDRSIRLYVGKVDGQYKITNYKYEDKSQAPRNDEEKRITEIPEGEYHLWCADMHMTLVVYDKIVEGEYYFQAGSTMSTSIKLNGRADNGLKLHLSQTSKVNGEDKGYMDGTFDGKTFKGEYDKDGYRHDFEIYVGGE